MRRREFMTPLGGSAAWSLSARAQQALPAIGFLHSASSDGNPDQLRAFRQVLKEAGFVAGENVAIEYRWAENQVDRLPMLVMWRAKKRKNLPSARHYGQVRFRFHTTKTPSRHRPDRNAAPQRELT